MKEKTKRKMLGKWLYAIYRRSRYLRYVKRLKKQRRSEYKLDEKLEILEIESTFKNFSSVDRLNEKRNRRIQKQEEKHELKVHRKAIKIKAREDRKLNRLRKKREKEEQIKLKRELQSNMAANRALEKQSQKEIKEKRRQQAKERKRRIRHIRPYLHKRRRRSLVNSVKSIDRHTIQRWFQWFIVIAENKNERRIFWRMLLNSTALFVLSYLCLYIIGQAITAGVAYSFDYKTILFYFKIYYAIGATDWTGDAVKILFSIQPVTGFILGIISLIIYNTKQNTSGTFKLFYLWVFINGMVMFFGSLLVGTLLNQGFGWVISYLYYMDTGKMVFSIISIFALVSLGTAVARSFLMSGNSYFNFINTDNRKFLVLSQVFLPALIGSAAIALLKFPPEYYYITSEEVTYEIIKLSTFILIILPIFISFSSFTDTYFDEEPRTIRINFWIILIVLILCAALYFGFSEGIILNTPKK